MIPSGNYRDGRCGAQRTRDWTPSRPLCAKGRSGISHRPGLAGLGFSCHVGGIPADLDILRDRYFEPTHQAGMGDSTVLGCVAGLDCWEDAGFRRERTNTVDWNTGVILGTGIGALTTVGKTLVPMTDAGRVRRLGSVIPERIWAAARAPAWPDYSAPAERPPATAAPAIPGRKRSSRPTGWCARAGPIARSPAVAKALPFIPGRRSTPCASSAATSMTLPSGLTPAERNGMRLRAGRGGGRRHGREPQERPRPGGPIYAEIAGAAVNCGGQPAGAP